MVCVVFGDNDPERIKSVMHAIGERFPGITLAVVCGESQTERFYLRPGCDSFPRTGLYRGRDGGAPFPESTPNHSIRPIRARRIISTRWHRRFAGLEPDLKNGGGRETLPLVYDLYTGTGTIAKFRSPRSTAGGRHRIRGGGYCRCES